MTQRFYRNLAGGLAIVIGGFLLLWYFYGLLFPDAPGAIIAFRQTTGWERFLRSMVKLALFCLLIILGFRLLRLRPRAPDSLFRRIRKAVESNPDEPLPEGVLESITGSVEDVRYVPGAMDALFGGTEEGEEEWHHLRNAVERVNVGEITDWSELEEALSDTSAISSLPLLYERMERVEITPLVRHRFWELARNSGDTEAVKLGICLGTFDLTERERSDLEIFARHPEFTVYVAHVFLRESETEPSYRDQLVELLPVVQGWGVVRLIEVILEETKLVDREEVPRLILIHGMENTSGVRHEVVQICLRHLDLFELFGKARSDDRLFRAVVRFMESLLLEPEPAGELKRMESGQDLLELYLDILTERDRDVWVLYGLVNVNSFLEEFAPEWPGRDRLLKKVRSARERVETEGVLRDGLEKKPVRDLVLSIIREDGRRKLVPDVVETCLSDDPGVQAVEVVGEYGEEKHLQRLRDVVTELRTRTGGDREDQPGKHEPGLRTKRDLVYASAVRHIGKVDSASSREEIREALTYHDARVRVAALKAMSDLSPDQWTEELAEAARSTEELLQGADRVKLLQVADQTGYLLVSESPDRDRDYTCPACGFLVFPEEPGSGMTCPICSWIDSRRQLLQPVSENGPNEGSLRELQEELMAALSPDLEQLQEFRRDDEWHPLPDVTSDRREKNRRRESGASSGNSAYYWK